MKAAQFGLGAVVGLCLAVFRKPLARHIAETEERFLSMLQKRPPEMKERKTSFGEKWSLLTGAFIFFICMLGLFQLLTQAPAP